MIRFLINFAVTISLLISISFAGLWIRGFSKTDIYHVQLIRWPSLFECISMHLNIRCEPNMLRFTAIRIYLPAQHLKSRDIVEQINLKSRLPRGMEYRTLSFDSGGYFNELEDDFVINHHTYYSPTEAKSDYWILAFRPWMGMVFFAILPGVQFGRRLQKNDAIFHENTTLSWGEKRMV